MTSGKMITITPKKYVGIYIQLYSMTKHEMRENKKKSYISEAYATNRLSVISIL